MNTTEKSTNPQTAAPGVAVDELMRLADEYAASYRSNGSCAADRAALRTALLAGAAGGEPVDWEPLEENPRERQMFDKQVELWGVQTTIATCLKIWGSMHSGGSYGAQCHIMANEVAKLYAHPPVPVRAPEGVTRRTVVEKSTCFSVHENGFVLGNFGGPDAEKNAKAFAALGADVSTEMDNRPLWDAIGQHAEAFHENTGRHPDLKTYNAFKKAHANLAELIGERLPDDYVAATPPSAAEPISEAAEQRANLDRYLKANYPNAKGASVTDRAIFALEEMDVALGMKDMDAGRFSPPPGEVQVDAARLDWIERNLFERKWSGTIGFSSEYFIRGDYRHTTQKMRGETLRAAIDAAIASNQFGVSGGA